MVNSREEELKALREQYNKDIELKDALLRLDDNVDFNLVFKEYLFKEALINAGLRKGHPNCMEQKIQDDLDAQIASLGRVSATLDFMVQKGFMAQESLDASYENEQDLLEG